MKRFTFAAVFCLVSSWSFGANDRGEGLFETCIPCHGEQGEGNLKLAAPTIAGMQEWYIVNQLKHFRGGARGYHPQDAGGLRMSPLARTLDNEEDVKTVAKYVAAMPKVPLQDVVEGGRPLKGKAAYAICSACHGPDAKGNEGLHAPDLTQTNDWYLLTQLKNFKADIRGAQPSLDPFGNQMAGQAKGIADEQAMKDLVTYIRSLR